VREELRSRAAGAVLGPAEGQLPTHTRIMHRLASDAEGRKQADGVTAK
jgi:hypothetical protein